MSKIHFILDLDYIWQDIKKPNIIAAKLFSYLEQKNEKVYFMRSLEETKQKHDFLYIFQEEKYYKSVPGRIFKTKANVISYSKLIKEVKTSKIGKEILACRPMYGVYENTIADNYELRIFFHDKEKIGKQQDSKRYEEEGVLICDKEISKLPKKEILSIFKELTPIINIAFLNPLNIDIFLDEDILQAFLKLRIKNSAKIKVVFKTVDQSYENYLKCFKVYKKIKDKFKNRIKMLDIMLVSSFHWKDATKAEEEFIRNLKLSTAAKKAEIKIKFIYPKNILITPFWSYFLPQKRVTNPNCYLENAIKPYCRTRNRKFWEIINDPKEWNNTEIEAYIMTLVQYPQIVFSYGAITSKGISEGLCEIDIDKLYENAKRRNLL